MKKIKILEEKVDMLEKLVDNNIEAITSLFESGMRLADSVEILHEVVVDLNEKISKPKKTKKAKKKNGKK